MPFVEERVFFQWHCENPSHELFDTICTNSGPWPAKNQVSLCDTVTRGQVASDKQALVKRVSHGGKLRGRFDFVHGMGYRFLNKANTFH